MNSTRRSFRCCSRIAASSIPLRTRCSSTRPSTRKMRTPPRGFPEPPRLPPSQMWRQLDRGPTGRRQSARAGRSDVDARHVRVALPGSRALGERLLDAAQLAGGEFDVHGGDVLLEVADVLGARDRDDVVALVEHPGKGELCRADALLARDLVYARDELEIVHRADPPREEAASERAIGDEADSELTHSGEDLVLGIAAPKRVLGLERSDRVNGVGPANRLRGRFG